MTSDSRAVPAGTNQHVKAVCVRCASTGLLVEMLPLALVTRETTSKPVFWLHVECAKDAIVATLSNAESLVNESISGMNGELIDLTATRGLRALSKDMQIARQRLLETDL